MRSASQPIIRLVVSTNRPIREHIVIVVNVDDMLSPGGGPAGGQDVAASMLPSEGLPLVSGRVSSDQ